jgi:hypothetical protein
MLCVVFGLTLRREIAIVPPGLGGSAMLRLLVPGLMLTSIGCSHLSNTEAGALGGGALGTAAGAVVGAATGNPRTGAVVGGLAGAGIGGLAGHAADQRERQEIRQAEAVANANAQAAAANPPLGISEVVRLTQQGVDPNVIIGQIQNTHSTFQLSTGDIEFLTANRVDPRVIQTMQSARAVNPVVYSPRPRAVYLREEPEVVYVRPYPRCRPIYYPPPPVGFGVTVYGR